MQIKTAVVAKSKAEFKEKDEQWIGRRIVEKGSSTISIQNLPPPVLGPK